MNLLNAYNNGVLRLEMLYVEAFNVLPDVYLYYKEDLNFDTFYLTREKCKEMFGNVDVRIISQDKIYSTSKAEENDYEWDETRDKYTKKNYPDILIIHYDEQLIASIDYNTIKILSHDFDAKTFVQDILKWLPQQEKPSKTASIDLVAYDNHYYTISSKIKRTEVNFDTHYNDDIKDMYKNLLSFLNERESGLAVLHGCAGSGNFLKILLYFK